MQFRSQSSVHRTTSPASQPDGNSLVVHRDPSHKEVEQDLQGEVEEVLQADNHNQMVTLLEKDLRLERESKAVSRMEGDLSEEAEGEGGACIESMCN